MITVAYRSIDRFSARRTFKTLAAAQRFAQKWIGETPEIGSFYAVSGDGVGRITVSGAAILDLFPKCREPAVSFEELTYEQQQGDWQDQLDDWNGSDVHVNEDENASRAYADWMSEGAADDFCPF